MERVNLFRSGFTKIDCSRLQVVSEPSDCSTPNGIFCFDLGIDPILGTVVCIDLGDRRLRIKSLPRNYRLHGRVPVSSHEEVHTSDLVDPRPSTRLRTRSWDG